MSIDWAILNWIGDVFKCDFLDMFMPKFTLIGEAGIVWIIIAIALLCTKKYRRLGILIGVVLILGLVICNGLLKNIVARPRPCFLKPDYPLLIKKPWDYSFPSGHAESGFAVATLIFLHNKKLGLAALILASSLAFSRLYLYVHFPSDIFGGILIGVALAILTYKCGNKIIDSLIERRKKA